MISTHSNLKPKPFLKWAGGKTQLLTAIEELLPSTFFKEDTITYIEPFVGGGALMFYILQRYPNISKAVINDINPHLIHTYQAIKKHPEELITKLSKIQQAYNILSQEDQKRLFLHVRDQFNKADLTLIDEAAFMIFLNRTCFNGLYRENSKGDFNVSFGKYKNPKIADADLIRKDSQLLQRV